MDYILPLVDPFLSTCFGFSLQILKGWVKQLTTQRGYTDQMVEDANAKLFTFGSYCLGVISGISLYMLYCFAPLGMNIEERLVLKVVNSPLFVP
jgi:hypothetical protein